MSLTGNYISAEDAWRLGLVNHVVPHEELLPFTHHLATDIVNNDERGVRTLLRHYRRLANTATLDEGHLLEGIMTKTWKRDPSRVAERRADVVARGRSQIAATEPQ
jgi:enoyl-CoA hydratase